MELTANQLISLDQTLYGHQHLCDKCGHQLVVCDLTPGECRQMAPGEWSWYCSCVDNEPPACATCNDTGTVPATGRGSDGFEPCEDCCDHPAFRYGQCLNCGHDATADPIMHSEPEAGGESC